jgi:2-keto-4-pentenoate hydratase/2-oxohepta-3-ene-1,7-dioic acid hydratase in catechol pathway
MKLTSFARNGKPSYGIVEGSAVLNIGAALHDRYPDLKSLLAAGASNVAQEAGKNAASIPLADIEYLPVIPNPAKIICIGLNYQEHVAETGRAGSEYPTIFLRFADTQTGHQEPVWIAPETNSADFEAELAVVIGKHARRVPKEKALDYVAGYSCYNDVSIRDWQRHTSQFIPGKNFPKTGGFGPWLVTKDEIPNPQSLPIALRLNGKIEQQSNTSHMIFSVADLIAYVTTFTPLSAGDVIITGTPSGVGFTRKPPLFLKPGDTMEVEISGIGTLRNPVIAEPR